MKLDSNQLKNLITFMSRVQLTGLEVQAYAELMTIINNYKAIEPEKTFINNSKKNVKNK